MAGQRPGEPSRQAGQQQAMRPGRSDQQAAIRCRQRSGPAAQARASDQGQGLMLSHSQG